MPFQIIRNDITKVACDVIVNTANPEPKFMAGTDSAVYRAAGEEKLLAERKKIGNIAAGDVAVTPAFDLPAKYIIHTVGPAWVDGKHHEFDILRSCYKKSLAKAAELGAEITRDYEGKELIMIGILKGAVVFLSDLCRAIPLKL